MFSFSITYFCLLHILKPWSAFLSINHTYKSFFLCTIMTKVYDFWHQPDISDIFSHIRKTGVIHFFTIVFTVEAHLVVNNKKATYWSIDSGGLKDFVKKCRWAPSSGGRHLAATAGSLRLGPGVSSPRVYCNRNNAVISPWRYEGTVLDCNIWPPEGWVLGRVQPPTCKILVTLIVWRRSATLNKRDNTIKPL